MLKVAEPHSKQSFAPERGKLRQVQKTPVAMTPKECKNVLHVRDKREVPARVPVRSRPNGPNRTGAGVRQQFRDWDKDLLDWNKGCCPNCERGRLHTKIFQGMVKYRSNKRLASATSTPTGPPSFHMQCE